jgi:hypothetical protein
MDEIAQSDIGEALYSIYHRCWDACQDPDDPYGRKPTHRCYALITYPIVKVTAKRIYFRHPQGTAMERDRIYHIDRAKFAADGHAYHRAIREGLYLTPDLIHYWQQQEDKVARLGTPKTVSELRREMADAHPDRGGSRDTFMAARATYLRAKGAR